MPLSAFDPVRDAATRSPLTPNKSFDFSESSPTTQHHDRPSRPTTLSALLNDHPSSPLTPTTKSSSLAHLLNDAQPDDDKLSLFSPLQRTERRSSSDAASRPSSSSSVTLTGTSSFTSPPTTMPPPSAIPYNPTHRKTPAKSVLVPMTHEEMIAMRNFVGAGTAKLSKKRKRARSGSPALDELTPPPTKKYNGDVGEVVGHYNSRPEVGVVQRQRSPIFGLKSFNNWVKSVLISRFTHPALQSSPSSSYYSSNNNNPRSKSKGKGKVLDLGCGKGGDLTKWSKANVREVVCVDIAEVSVDQARTRWETMKGLSRFDATFAALDCFSEPLSHAVPPDKLVVPFDVVSMQFCMHYAFESEDKVHCMLRNVSRWLRKGGVFVGTIPNAEQLLEHLDELPPGDNSFGNEVYRITFQDRRSRPLFGHKYYFWLQDAVDNVPEYIVYWDNFTDMAAGYGLHCVYKEEFHTFFEEHQEDKDYAQLLTRMNVVDANGESCMTEDQWEAANVYFAFAFEKR